MNNVVMLKGARPPKNVRSSMETMLLNPEQVNQWLIPPFQRPLRVNDKVRALSEQLKIDGVIPGVITLGQVGTKATTYIVDGQHRVEGFRIAGLKECIADVRLCHFDDMADMAEEFVLLNTAIVRMRPDDVLRGMESSLPALQKIRNDCPWVGYDQIRRSAEAGPVVSMAVVLKTWLGSAPETPACGGTASMYLARDLDMQGAEQVVSFMQLAFAAWGRDLSQSRLWATLNLALCMWLYRRLVLNRDHQGEKRFTRIDSALFKKCLMSVAADGNYHDWLQGRLMRDRDRSPAYARLKAIFARRILSETGTKAKLPGPAWFSSR